MSPELEQIFHRRCLGLPGNVVDMGLESVPRFFASTDDVSESMCLDGGMGRRLYLSTEIIQ